MVSLGLDNMSCYFDIMSSVKRSSFCDLPVADIDKASGYIGKGSDPSIFPRCPHALHAECMRAWQYGECIAEQRRLLDRRRAPRHAKLLRGTGLVSYDYHFRGA